MTRFTFTTFAAALMALSMSGARTSACTVNVDCLSAVRGQHTMSSSPRTSACDINDPGCGGRTVPAADEIACDAGDPSCSGRTVPVLIAECDPTCGGRTIPTAVKIACDMNDPTCGRDLPVTKTA